jgi:hypothetical protein
VSDNFHPDEDFDLDGEYFHPEQQDLFPEPHEEYDPVERHKVMEEWAAEATQMTGGRTSLITHTTPNASSPSSNCSSSRSVGGWIFS